MRVALIVEGVFPEKKGGLERWYKHLAEMLHRNGHNVTYLNSSLVSGTRSGINFVNLIKTEWKYLPGGVRSVRDSVKFSVSLFKHLLKSDVEIIYCSSVPIISIFSAWLAAKIRRKILVVEWFEYWPLNYWLGYSGKIIGILGWFAQLLATQCGAKVVTFNRKTTKNLIKLSAIRDAQRVNMMPGQCGNASDLEFNKRNEIKDNFMFLGRFVDEKQPDLAVRSAVALREKGWSGKLNMFGTGPNLHSITRLVSDLKAENFIQIHQNASDAEVRKAMDESFILFHPTKREGYGYAQVEAAFRGLPTLLIRYPLNASTELMINPELYLKCDDLEQIADVLLNAFKNQVRYSRITQNWAVEAATSKSSELSLKKIEELMIYLCNNRKTK